MRATAMSVIAAALLIGATTAQAVTPYRITDLGALPGFTESAAHAINDRGQIAGYSYTGSLSSRASIWQAGALTGLPDADGIDSTKGYAINELGEVVGFGNGAPAFFWSGTTVTKLNELPGGSGGLVAFGINSRGEVVGNVLFPQNQARYIHDGQVSPLPESGAAGYSAAWAISDSGHIVGASNALGPGVAAYWENATTQPVPLPHGSFGVGGTARAVNEQGDAAGGIQAAGDVLNRHAALWVGRVPALLPDAPGMGGSEAFGINDARQVVGRSAPTMNFSTFLADSHATLWENGIVYDLNDLIPAGSGWTLYAGWDINNLGQIVGEGRNPDGQMRGFLLTPIPEPEQYVMLLAGLAVLAAIRRKGD